MNVSWPLARIRVLPNQVEIRVLFPLLWRRFVLWRRDIRRVTFHSAFLSTGLRFEHDSPRSPECLVFYAIPPRKLMRRLAEMGYPTEESAA